MQFGLIQATVGFGASTAMALYVLTQQSKSRLHWTWLGVLGGMVLWNAGVLARFSVAPELLGAAVALVLNGVLLTSAFWLLAAHAYHAQQRNARLHTALLATVAAVTGLLVLGVFTNEAHGLFYRPDVDAAALEAGPPVYGRALFWGLIAWSYLCNAAAMGIYMLDAVSLLRRDARQRGLLLAAASAVPIALSTAYVFQLVPVRQDLTPSGLIVSVLLLYLAVSRFHLFESLPMARREVVHHLGDGVVMASADGRITDWNPAAAALFSDPPLRVDAPLAQQLASLEGDAAKSRRIEVSCATLRAENGAPTGQFAILADRTDAQRLERLARQNQRLEIVGALAAGFAHEVNDPLSYVHANLVEIERLGARVEEEGAGPDAELAKELVDLRVVANESLEGVARIRRISGEMRGLSRDGQDDCAMLDLVGVARTALRLSRLEPYTGGPRIELCLEAVPPVFGREGRLVQLVLNLLVNARQVLVDHPDPRIALETRGEGRSVELVVRDNGPGIPEDVRERIFDPFFTTRAADSGTGLGLAIAFDIAREHGGELEASRAPGGGARFVLRLPTGLVEAARAGRATRISGSPT